MMARYRSILALILAFVATFVVSCGSPTDIKAKTYTSAQIEQIEQYAQGITGLRDRLPELATMIENRDWNNVESFIHGPLGDIRARMSSLSRQLMPDAQKAALETSQNVFGHFVKIDESAQLGSYTQAIRNYAELIKDFDAFLNQIPKA